MMIDLEKFPKRQGSLLPFFRKTILKISVIMKQFRPVIVIMFFFKDKLQKMIIYIHLALIIHKIYL